MYNTLLTEVSTYLKPYLRGKVASAEIANDLLQDVLLSFHRARHTYDSAYPLKPWLFKIVQSRLVDHFRKTGNRQELALVDDSFFEAISAEAEISQIEVEDFKRAVASLSDDQRSILCALKLEGKSIRQVSSEMAMSEAAVKVAAHRAYARLFDLMEVDS